MSVAERLHNVAAHNFSTNYTEAHLFLLGRTSLQIVCDAARAPIRRIPTSAAWTALAELRTPSEISWLTIPIEPIYFQTWESSLAAFGYGISNNNKWILLDSVCWPCRLQTFPHLKSLSSNVRSLISMPESRMAAMVLGNSSRATSASFSIEMAALLIAWKFNQTLKLLLVSSGLSSTIRTNTLWRFYSLWPVRGTLGIYCLNCWINSSWWGNLPILKLIIEHVCLLTIDQIEGTYIQGRNGCHE